MPELYESSGLLSLASLREHEKKQARELAEAARARAEAEQRARLEAAQREQERQNAELRARDLAASAQRAQQLRLEVSARAEAERASALARSCQELRLNLDLERAARRTAELALTARLLRQRLVTSVAAVLCVGLGIAAFALYFGALRPAAERSLGAAEQALLTEQRAHREAEASVLDGVRRASELSARVDSLEQRLRDAATPRPTPAPTQPSLQRPGAPPRVVTVPQRPCRDDGDPLNPCLRH